MAIADRFIELAILIFKNTQGGNLLGKLGDSGGLIFAADAQKNKQACRDRTDCLSLTSDGGAANALNKGFHAAYHSASIIPLPY